MVWYCDETFILIGKIGTLPDMVALKEAVNILKRGGLVGYPTESFFAIGADATNSKAIQKLRGLKRREQGKPIALIASDLAQVRKFFNMSKEEERLASKYWPALGSEARARRGAVTILLTPKAPTTPSSLAQHPSRRRQSGYGASATSGRRGWIATRLLYGTSPGSPFAIRGGMRIGVRVPVQAGARRLAKALGVPITATSANISGQRPTKSRQKLTRVFSKLSILAGTCGRSKRPSTVIGLDGKDIRVFREGSVRV